MRRYAEKTHVAVSKSRGEIDKLLREWGAKGIQWSDDFENNYSQLRFVWAHDGTDYMARFRIQLPGRDALEDKAIDGRTGYVSELKLKKLMADRGRQEHRLLLLWIKAALNAVSAGIVDAESIFLPFLEDANGQTVAEIALPRLQKLVGGSATKLLTQGRS